MNVQGVTQSPIKGEKKGNIEFLIYVSANL